MSTAPPDDPPQEGERAPRLGFGWGTAGFVAGCSGLGVSYLVAALMGVRTDPVTGVAEAIIRLTPGGAVEAAIDLVGQWDKPLLVGGILAFLAAAFWYAGRASATSMVRSQVVFVLLAAVGGAAVLTRSQARPTDGVPVLAGALVWLLVLPWLTRSLRVGQPATSESRRSVLVTAGAVLAASAAAAGIGRFLGRGRRRVEATRRLLRLPVTQTPPPPGVETAVAGSPPWKTPNGSFYLIHTAVVIPALNVDDWRLRIHGMVDRELTLSYQDLLDRGLTEAWITLNCVSNEIGGELIGNTWWSGVRIADVLAEVGVQAGADAVKQTSEDGWTCGTPLTALTDDRNAMLALAMDGVPLPLEHGFPVRMLVPGLYGYVSATKWLVDLEVTRFADFDAFWTDNGWSEQGPVKLASRVDVPRDGETVPAGTLAMAGTAWMQRTGIEAVEVSLDGGPWRPTTLARAPSIDTWVQWRTEAEVEAGDHEVAVRAVSRGGEVQTSVVRDTVPDGATGWHRVGFTAE